MVLTITAPQSGYPVRITRGNFLDKKMKLSANIIPKTTMNRERRIWIAWKEKMNMSWPEPRTVGFPRYTSGCILPQSKHVPCLHHAWVPSTFNSPLSSLTVSQNHQYILQHTYSNLYVIKPSFVRGCKLVEDRPHKRVSYIPSSSVSLTSYN